MAKAAPKKSTSKPAASTKSEFLSNSDEQEDPEGILIYGPPKTGKTFCAATMSKKWPVVIPPKGKVVLDDMAWITFDAGALSGLKSMGIRVPYVIEAREILASFVDIEGALDHLYKLVKEVSDDGGINWIVADTISMMDNYLSQFYRLKYKGGTDRWAVPNAVKNAHSTFYTELSLSGMGMIFLCHSKARPEDQKANVRASIAVPDQIKMSVTGQSDVTYNGNCSLTAPLISYRDTKTKKIVRKLYPQGGKGFEGGSRWAHLLNEVEEPHLGNIYKRVHGS